MKTLQEMSDAEIGAIVRAKDIEVWHPMHQEWQEYIDPLFHPEDHYRIKPSKPSINWDHVHEKCNYLAMDKDGEWLFYKNKPTKGQAVWTGGKYMYTANLTMFASFDPGNCNWKDSLISRPGVDE